MKRKFLTALALSILLVSCGGEKKKNEEPKESSKKETTSEAVPMQKEKTTDPKGSKGVGPITSITFGEIDNALVDKGKELFKANCTACHKMGKRVVGPALKGITERRTPEWIMNMILNPEGMVSEDPAAKALLEEYLAPMANQGLTEEEARAILELFRTHK